MSAYIASTSILGIFSSHNRVILYLKMGAWFDKPAEIPRNETAAFKYTVELNIKYKDGHGNV